MLFDRVVILLRPGDAAVLRANYPGGASHFIREMVASHTDYIRKQQRRKAKAERERLEAAMSDPNL
jgi:hypothetical protein